jgi:spore coat polysaccharide biosynthesis predicted glycosyltransferase SpsG
MVRKGNNKKRIPQTSNAILLDNKSHKEIASIMNQCEYFVSYDTETLYSQYAVLCGCKSIVVPNESVPKEQWQPKKEFRYGIAYGWNEKEIKEAEKTKHLVYNVLKNEEEKSNKSVDFFIETCENYFKKRLF